MTDREKLLSLYKQLQDIKLPTMDSPELQKVVNTIEEGLKMILGWLAKVAREHFGGKNR